MSSAIATILNVDHSGAAREGTSRILREAGYTVVEATCGGEALRLVREQLPQLVIINVNLPDMSGPEVCRQIKGDSLTRAIPVIQISPTTPHGSHAVTEDGADIHLVGAVEPLEISTAVRVLLRLRGAERAVAELESALEQERAARRRAEDATRLKDEFLANVSHELRTPMNAVIGWTHLLRSGRLDEAQRQRALESIDRGARSQARMIEDLLDVSRIVSGKLSLSMEPLDLVGVIDAALESQRPAAQAKGVTIGRGAAPARVTVLGDPGRLQQVFLNLLTNALKFTPASGRIDVTLASDGERVQVAVSDTGEGIDPELLPHVFERFRQADGTSTRTHTGLGVGLAIVRHVIELHGGSVAVRSDGRGKGATFTVTIPLAPAEVAGRRPIPKRMPGSHGTATGSGIRVLVVEDDPGTREIIAAVLERSGFAYRLATRAEEALALLEDWRPDAIVSDIAMPDVDGYEFIRQLRARPAHLGGSTPALALTAYTRGDDRDRALACGYQAHVTKPVDPLDLIRAITELTRRAATHDGAQM